MNQLQSFIAGLPFGFLTAEQMPQLISLDRLHPCLVRCGSCRFTCPAQDVAHLIKCVEAGGDYVRDVSLPVGSTERAASWVQEETIVKMRHQATNTREACLLGQVANKATARGPVGYHFNENDCGGVFTGHGVISDADSGL